MTSTLTQDTRYTLVVGLGVTGLSVARYLVARGEDVVVVDSRDLPPGLKRLRDELPQVEFHGGVFDEELFISARRIILSPGVPLSDPAVQSARTDGVEVLGDLDLFAETVSAPVVAITGSNGKSTVTTLLARMAERDGSKVVMAGNIGRPVLDAVGDDAQLYVLELSSFQLETLHRLPMVASVVLNISEDHMDRYPDLDAYIESKRSIYSHAEKCVINRDDTSTHVDRPADEVVGFTLEEPSGDDFGLLMRDGDAFLARGSEALMSIDEMRLKGDHNVANALAALALGEQAGLELSSMLDAIREFDGLSHRTQWVANVDGVDWYNDSKATNVGATIAAVTGLPGKHVLIAGGESKDADFTDLRQAAESHLSAAVLIGRDADQIAAVLSSVVDCHHAASMQEAVALAKVLSAEVDNVLLSPACASFDMFENFEHRGEVFMEAVRGLS